MKREAVGGSRNMLEMVLDTHPQWLLKSEASLQAPPVAPLAGKPRCVPTGGRKQGFQYPDWN